MQLSFRDLQYVVGDEAVAENLLSVRPLRPFADEVLDFFDALSKRLLKSGREFSDVATFGFWCRKAALAREKSKYDDLDLRLGKGVVFHSTPSNVPVNFAFSFAAGLLAGNANIVRLPGKSFEQVSVICKEVNELITKDFINLAPYICMVKYPPNREINDAFSRICDCRVVWGGDGTINEMRLSPMKTRATEITFADRHSIAVINADEYLKTKDKAKVALDFYNDTYFSDQNACTAPRLIVWLGKKKEQAKEVFWGETHRLTTEKYSFAPVQAVGKLSAACRVAAEHDVKLEPHEDNYITRIRVGRLDEGLMQFKYNSGFFFEYDAKSIDEIVPICNQRCQTLTYYGLSTEELRCFIETCRPYGMDRAVPMGKSMDFALIWDGHDLIRELSRRITVL